MKRVCPRPAPVKAGVVVVFITGVGTGGLGKRRKMGRFPRSSRHEDKNMSVSCGRQALSSPLEPADPPNESGASEPHSFPVFLQYSPSAGLGFSHSHPGHSGLLCCWAGGFLRAERLKATMASALGQAQSAEPSLSVRCSSSGCVKQQCVGTRGFLPKERLKKPVQRLGG